MVGGPLNIKNRCAQFDIKLFLASNRPFSMAVSLWNSAVNVNSIAKSFQRVVKFLCQEETFHQATQWNPHQPLVGGEREK